MYFNLKATSKRISELREKKKITQEELAEQLNITVNYLGKIETGFRTPSLDLFVEMAEYFEVSLDYIILGRIESPNFIKEEIAAAINILASCVEKI